MSNSRTRYAAKNFLWGTVGNLVNSMLGFISRTVFIYTLGTIYLGVNGLFTNILGMLSLAELGVGTAISFSLYKPLAEKNIPHIQAIINFYKTAYRVIAIVVSVIGISIIPFLGYLVKGADGINNIQFIYFIFLFNTVTSYLISFKATILSADQRNYLLTNINTFIKIVTTIIQILILLVFHNFILYLIIGAIIQLIGQIYINYFTNKQYPYLKEKNNEKLSVKDKKTIFTKIRALILHKIGEVSIYQTDNIITSVYINVNTVGLVSNFVLIINIINSFIMSFFNSATAGFGNLIATETVEKRFKITKRYDFFGFIFFGWSAIVLYFLLSPFVTLWIGSDKLVDEITVAILCINYYLTGMRVPLSNIKMAAGLYEQDKYISIIQSGINIVASIIGAKFLGLKGIYLGTLISSLIPNFIRPYFVYKYVLETSCKKYFIEYFFRIGLLIVIVLILKASFAFIYISNTYLNFIIMFLGTTIFSALIILLVYIKSDEYQYLINIIKMIRKRIINK